MKTIKVIASLILIFFFQSCLDLRTCNKNLDGEYVCKNNPEAENYLVLRDNGTFLHYYKENNLEFTDTGTWKKSSSGYCTIEFSNWKTFNESGKDYKELGNGILWISGQYLDIGPDGESSVSFIRKRE